MKNKVEIKYIKNLLMKYKGKLLINIILTIFTFFMFIIIPLIEKKIIDEGFINREYQYLLRLVVLSVVLTLLIYLITYIQSHIQSGMVVSCRAELKKEALRHGMRLKMKYIKEKGLHTLITDANYDINVITQIFSNNITFLLTEFLKIIGYTIGLLLLNWKLTLFVILIVPAKVVIANIVGAAKTKKIQDLITIQKQISQWQSDFYPGVNEIKNWSIYQDIEDEYSGLVIKKEKISKFVDIYSAIDSFLKNSSEKLLFGGLYIIAAGFIWRNDLTLGAFFAFTTYATSLFYPIDIVTNIKMELSEILPSIKSYNEFMCLEEEKFDGKSIPKVDIQEIRFDHVSFAYENQQVLNDFSLTLNRHEKTAIIGKNGSGKSTISNLLLRYIEPNEGKIEINGVDISEYALNEYRDLFAAMSQTVYLFNYSIENNVYMNRVYEKEKRLDFKSLLNFVSKLSDGFQTVVGMNGGNFSGGERQRIALARALQKESQIMLLDEATSNCDVETEQVFLDNLNIRQNEMIIMITHNYRLLKDFDRIIVIDNGEIIADGTYEDLRDILIQIERS